MSKKPNSSLHLVTESDRVEDELVTYDDVRASRQDHLADDLAIQGKCIETLARRTSSIAMLSTGQGMSSGLLVMMRYLYYEYLATANRHPVFQRSAAPQLPNRSAYDALMQAIRNTDAVILTLKTSGKSIVYWEWVRYYLTRLGVDWFTLLDRMEPGMTVEIPRSVHRPPTPKWIEKHRAETIAAEQAMKTAKADSTFDAL